MCETLIISSTGEQTWTRCQTDGFMIDRITPGTAIKPQLLNNNLNVTRGTNSVLPDSILLFKYSSSRILCNEKINLYTNHCFIHATCETLMLWFHV